MKNTILINSLIGAGVGYLFYKLTKPKAVVAPITREHIIVKIPIPKTVGEANLMAIAEKLEPSRITPSFSPIGVNLEWETISVDTPIGTVRFSPPKKFVPLENLHQIYNIKKQLKSQIEDKGAYWEVSLKIGV